jgi:hypothetical protein
VGSWCLEPKHGRGGKRYGGERSSQCLPPSPCLPSEERRSNELCSYLYTMASGRRAEYSMDPLHNWDAQPPG